MNASPSRLQSLHQFLDRWFTPIALVVTRVAFGQAFALTGWGKLHNLEKITEFFRGLGIPAPEIQAPFIGTLEFVGGLCLVLGLVTRPAALLLLCTMIVALATAHPGDLGQAFALDMSFADIAPVPFLVALLWLIAKGPGRFSLDHVIARRGGGS